MSNSKKDQVEELSVSVIINTCNRGAYIADTLDGLQRQTYKNFEVIVVNGPSLDNTEEVVKKYDVRYYTAPYNLSVSRNIGIKSAAGEILAFIDDDAVPDIYWLEDIVRAYDDPKIGAAGGRVFNADGTGFQFSYGRIGVWGYPETRHTAPFSDNSPEGDWFNINIGTNASYRRSALVEIGGFDEEIEYYHDESDVCVRLIQAGYQVAQLEHAYVHHKMAPSFRRKDSTKTVVWDAVVKNTIYFALLNTAGKKKISERVIKPYQGEKDKLSAPFKLVGSGDFTRKQAIVRYLSLWRSIYRGYARGFSGKRKLMQGYAFNPSLFKKFTRIQEPKHTRHFLLVSQGYPPMQTDGIARYTHVLSKELLKLGHKVSVITKVTGAMTEGSFLVDGAWVHRHDSMGYLAPTTGLPRLDHQLAHARSVLATARRVDAGQKVDMILAPLWDAEGIGLFTHKIAPTMLTLMSPLKKVVETQWFNNKDASYEATYELEKECILRADGIMSISNNIKKTIADLYEIDWGRVSQKVPVATLPLGVDPSFIISDVEFSSWLAKDGLVEVLYVGRPERRKGIDILLQAVPTVLAASDKIRIRFVGGLDGNDENGASYYGAFRKKYQRESWYDRIEFAGRLSDFELAEAYKRCDIFVAPSRYESFGQIYIEAMAAGKPVIGVRAGGAPEVVRDRENGYLIKSEDHEQLSEMILRLAGSQELRAKMGAASLRIINEKFSSSVLARGFLRLANEVLESSVNS